MIAYCGLDSSQCDAYIATIKDDLEKLKELGEEWSPSSESFNSDEIRCYGCTQSEDIFEWCKDCDVRSCAQEKELTNCGYCDDYLCDKVSKPLEKNLEAEDRLDNIHDKKIMKDN